LDEHPLGNDGAAGDPADALDVLGPIADVDLESGPDQPLEIEEPGASWAGDDAGDVDHFDELGLAVDTAGGFDDADVAEATGWEMAPPTPDAEPALRGVSPTAPHTVTEAEPEISLPWDDAPTPAPLPERHEEAPIALSPSSPEPTIGTATTADRADEIDELHVSSDAEEASELEDEIERDRHRVQDQLARGGLAPESADLDDIPASNGSWPAATIGAALGLSAMSAGLARAFARHRGLRREHTAADVVGMLDDAGAEARLEHGDLYTIETALAEGDVVVVSRDAARGQGAPTPLRLVDLDRAAGMVTFEIVGRGASHEYAIAIQAFVDCWSDTSGQMLVVEHPEHRTVILPVTLGTTMMRAVERSV